MKDKWSGRQDLNLRPLAPHASALPGCATARHKNKPFYFGLRENSWPQKKMAARQGFEPRQTEPKSAVLPLHHQATDKKLCVFLGFRQAFSFDKCKLILV
jgi:hypothetical protein